MTELKAPRRTGKWLRDDVPHTGWRCIEMKDEGIVCEMCEVTKITYNHIMIHDSLPSVALDCGYVCAAFMTGNPEQELLRERVYEWQRIARAARTPIQKLRRKGWRCEHLIVGKYVWTLYRGENRWDASFVVTVENRDGWRYSLRRGWWLWHDTSGHIHSEPFESDLEAVLAGIARAELLLVDPEWMADDAAARAACKAQWQAENEMKDLALAIRILGEEGYSDLVTALQQGSITREAALEERRRRAHRSQPHDRTEGGVR